MKIKLLILLIICSSAYLKAQNAPVFRQFYFNTYLFNPSYVGIDGYTSLMVFHRQQWLNFNNAPSASGFNIQYPTANRAAFGVSFINQEVVALRNSAFTTTFAYRIPVSSNQFVSFGLSGGMGVNDLNLDDGDYSNDPTIVNAAANSFYADGNFGMLYSLGRLRIGFALPRLFGQKYFSPQDLGETPYSQLKNQLYSLSYRLYFGSGNLALEPYFLYRMNRDGENFWEASSNLYFKDKIWIGASYNETLGVGFFLGMDFAEKFRFGYSYELPPVSPDFVSTSSHELHLQVRLGKKKIFKWAVQPPGPALETAKAEPGKVDVLPDQPAEEAAVIIPELDRTEKPRKPADLVVPQPMEEVETKPQEEAIITDQKPPPQQVRVTTPPFQPVMAPGHYVVVGTFGNAVNATREKQRFINLCYDDAYMAQNPYNKMYYVYIFSSSDSEIARQTRDYYRTQRFSREAWVLTIE